MNVKELISSGVIELYCLGIASDEERSVVEELMLKDPSVKEEIALINDALAHYAVAASAVIPSVTLKEKILSAIQSPEAEPTPVNLPPKLTPQSTAQEWLQYLSDEHIEEPAEHDDVHMIELPGTESYYSYAVFARPGGIVNEETHFGHDEYLLIVEGECEMTIGGKTQAYKPGDFITITPGIPHSAVVTGKSRMIVIGQRRAA